MGINGPHERFLIPILDFSLRTFFSDINSEIRMDRDA